MTEFKKREAEYWQERFEAVEQNSAAYGKTAYIEIEKAFSLAEKDIQKEIDAWYARLAKNNGITLSEAKKLLGNKELKEFQWDVAEYIKYGRENAINGQWVKQLENASAKVHISQLEALKIRTQQSLEAAFKTEFDEIKKMGLDVVEDSCYRTAFEIQKGCGVGWQIGEIDKGKIDKIISKPWTTDGKTFSDRIWSRKQQMISDLQQELTRSCIYGRPFEETVKRMEQYVSSNVKNAKYAAERLVRTENASFSSMGQKEGLEKIGTKWYKIYVTIDGKTCPVCREMNGKKFRMSDFQIGITAPPFHPNCDKSSIGPTTPDNEEDEDELDRIIREVEEENEKANTLSEKERFEEWKKKFVYGDKSEAEVVDKSENGGIINSYKGKGLSVISDSEIDSKTIEAINEATKKVTSDFRVLENYSESIRFSDIVGGLAENVYRPDTGLNIISLDKRSFSNPSELLEILKNDFASGKSYETDTIQSLVAHEMGHSAHIALALKRADIPYGKQLSQIEIFSFQEQYNKISENIYIAAFKDETLQEIYRQCNNELGSMTVGNAHELIAQSFGNYYYGTKKSEIAKKVVKYFMKELN